MDNLKQFFQDPFQEVLFQVGQLKKDWYRLLAIEEEVSLSRLFEISFLQDPLRFRQRHYALCIATYLIDNEGAFRKDRAQKVLAVLNKTPSIIGINRVSDTLFFNHTQKGLHFLLESKEFILEHFRLPLCHKKAEQLIHETARLKPNENLTNAHLRRAVLSAYLTPLRQSVGSCFATAPAILIQSDQPQNFFRDLLDLLNTGKIKRTFAGKEYSVPLNPSSGIGDLAKPWSFCSDIAMISFCPGLINALEAIGFIDGSLKWEQKIAQCLGFIQKQQSSSNTADFLRNILLEHYQLTAKDFNDEKKRIELQALSQNLGQMHYNENEKSKKIREYNIKLEQGFAAFKNMVDNPLLKSWEFTLASLSDLKLVFTKWNLYVGLGFDPKEENGLGKFIYDLVNEKLQECNEKIKEYQFEYERAVNFINTAQRLANQSEITNATYEMNQALQMRDLFQKKAELYAELFALLIQKYFDLFQEYFQELYDPEMHEINVINYNDSPAGFRLVYKHGRSDPIAWTSIYTSEDYINSLRDFFHHTESEVTAITPLEIREDASQIITEIIIFLQSPTFLQNALKRCAISHEQKWEEGKDISKLEKKPWSYTSGGTMDTLLKIYYKKEELPFFSKSIGSENDLFLFVKEASKEEKRLMLSPVHAFVLYPRTDFNIGQNFYEGMQLDSEQQNYLLEELAPLLNNAPLKAIFPRHPYNLSIAEFRNELLLAVKKAALHKIDLAKIIDGFLYSALPLQDFKESCQMILQALALPDEIYQKAANWLSEKFFANSMSTAKRIRDAVISAILFAKQDFFQEHDFFSKVSQVAKDLKMAYPHPIIFADTNWPHNFFGFVMSPATQKLELWALDRTGMTGFPMTEWKIWFDETKPAEWGIYDKNFDQ